MLNWNKLRFSLSSQKNSRYNQSNHNKQYHQQQYFQNLPNYYQTTYNSSINQPNQNYYHTATHIDTSQSQPSSNVNSPVPRIHSPSSKSPRGLASGYLTSYNSNYQQNNKSSNNQGKYSLNKNPSMNSQSSTSKYISM